jgi:hypothetical protein
MEAQEAQEELFQQPQEEGEGEVFHQGQMEAMVQMLNLLSVELEEVEEVEDLVQLEETEEPLPQQKVQALGVEEVMEVQMLREGMEVEAALQPLEVREGKFPPGAE